MSRLRHLRLVAVLVFAQWAALAHGVEHAAGEGKGLPQHACELCLTAHDLGSALPAALPPPVVAGVTEFPFFVIPCGRGALPPPLARQGAPPFTA